MRPVLAAFTCALALGAPLGLAACGGDDRPYDAVPASTPELVPPDDANDLASGVTGPSGTSTQPSTTTGTTPSQSTTPSTGGTAPAPSTGGTATPSPTPAPAPQTGGGTAPGTGGGATPDTGGVSPDDTAAAGSVQQFCADNPGAC